MSTQDPAELPPRLQEQLRAAYTPPDGLTAADDRAILAAIRRRPRAGRLPRLIAIAASLAILITAASVILPQIHSRARVAAGYHRTGDIRDAYYLARQLRDHKPVQAAWDANRDGVIDEKDVESLALAAVRIDRGATP